MDQIVSEYWTLRGGPDGRILRCELVRTALGPVVRCGNGDLARRERVASETAGLATAAGWKEMFEAKGWTAIAAPAAARASIFKIDRSQRIHSDGVMVRVYEVFGQEQYGWDTNREDPPDNRPLFNSRMAAQEAADEALRRSGHVCTEVCYQWRLLM